jgi:sodium-coupled neutral amino acid transporter 11
MSLDSMGSPLLPADYVATPVADLPVIESKIRQGNPRSGLRRAEGPYGSASSFGSFSQNKMRRVSSSQGIDGLVRVPSVLAFGNPDIDMDGAEPGTASVTSGVLNLTNTILGSGIIAMPFVCRSTGWGFFLGMLLFAAWLSHFAIACLFDAVGRTTLVAGEEFSYTLLGRKLFGRTVADISSWAVTLQQFGCCIAYVVIVGDILQPVMEAVVPASSPAAFLVDRATLQATTFVFVVFPLCLLRSMDALKYASFIAILCLTSFVLVVVGYGLEVNISGSVPDVLARAVESHGGRSSDDFVFSCSTTAPDPDPGRGGEGSSHAPFTPCDEVRAVPHQWLHLVTALPIFCFAFLCHQNTFPIYRELRDASPAKMRECSAYSMGICTVIYFGCGTAGYLTFRELTQSDLLNNFATTGSGISAVVDVVRLAFGLALVLSYPIVVWEARHNIVEILFNGRDMRQWEHVGLNLVIVTATTAIGILAPDIEVVLKLVGSTCSPLMVFVLPSLFYLRATERNADGTDVLAAGAEGVAELGSHGGATAAGAPAMLAEPGRGTAVGDDPKGRALAREGVWSVVCGGAADGPDVPYSTGERRMRRRARAMLWFGLVMIVVCTVLWVIKVFVPGALA